MSLANLVRRGVSVRRFLRDEKGVVLPFAAIAITALFGFAALALDASRLFALNTQLQKAADALALAAAAELDGRSDSITRANAAISTLMANKNTGWFADDKSITLTSGCPVFLKSLPGVEDTAGDDTTTIETSDCTIVSSYAANGDPTVSRFVLVRVATRSMGSVFPLKLFGFPVNSLSTSAVSVAGFSQVFCEPVPLMICNPYETVGMTKDQATAAFLTKAADPAERRRLMKIDNDYPTKQVTAGNFGLVDVTTQSANDLSMSTNMKRAAAAVQPKQCGVTGFNLVTKPGNDSSLDQYFNLRFRIRNSNNNLFPGDTPTVPIAKSVRKGGWPSLSGNAIYSGASPDWCSYDPTVPSGIDTTITTKNPAPRYQVDVSGNELPVSAGLIEDTLLFDANGLQTNTDAWAQANTTSGHLAKYWSANYDPNANLKTDVSTPSGTTLKVQTTADTSAGSIAYPTSWTTRPIIRYDTVSTTTCNAQGRNCQTTSTSVPVYGSPVFNGASIPSRYDVYRFETDTPAALGARSRGFLANKSCTGSTCDVTTGTPGQRVPGEDPNPPCTGNGFNYATTPASGTRDPRLISAAVVNCRADGAVKILSGASAFRPVAIGSFFLAGPVRKPSTSSPSTMYLELTGVIDQTNDSRVRQLVQLYR